MRQAHLLLILLILVAVGSHAYVALNWDYRDAPNSVKYALGLGFLVTALLAILLGPKMLRGRGRGAIILPVLVSILFASMPVSHADSMVEVSPGETYSIVLNGTGWYRITWRAEVASAGPGNTIVHGRVAWNGYTYHEDGYGVWLPWGHWITEYAPAGAEIIWSVENDTRPARIQYNITHIEGTVFPITLTLEPFSEKCLNITTTGRYTAIAYIEGHPDAWGESLVTLIGSEKNDSWSIIAKGKYLYSRGENIKLCLKSRKPTPININGYTLLKPLPTETNASINLEPANNNQQQLELGLGILALLGLSLLVFKYAG
ncbi:MAG: hypothetical protein GSR77_03770 [Desulfurococcales archaeon]|nr:hypothetical protein [Desulfurococcales archaeon]